MRKLRCLLISPLPPGDPENGDAQYTRDLLADPPAGVTYVPYQEALASGELAEEASWRPGGVRPSSPSDVAIATGRLGLNVLRRTSVLLPDPVRWWRVRAPFDVVHVHCMPTHLSGGAPPIVLTDSAGTLWYWTRARGVDEAKARRQLRRERRLAAILHYVHASARPDDAAEALYFVNAGARLARELGANRDNLGVCPVGVPDPTPRNAASNADRPLTLAFVAHNFKIKGGPAALEIFRRVRASIPDVRLLVAGPEDADPGIPGVEWLGHKTRDELYAEVYPAADVFVYPTRFDAAPLVVMEALAHGVPVIAPSILALPELVTDGRSGLLFAEGDLAQATELTLRVLGDADLRRRLGEGARAEFSARFSVAVRNERLLDAYLAASALSRSRPRRTPARPARPAAGYEAKEGSG